ARSIVIQRSASSSTNLQLHSAYSGAFLHPRTVTWRPAGLSLATYPNCAPGRIFSRCCCIVSTWPTLPNLQHLSIVVHLIEFSPINFFLLVVLIEGRSCLILPTVNSNCR